MTTRQRKQLILIVPPGRYREPRLNNAGSGGATGKSCSASAPDVDRHVIEAPVVFGQPINEEGEAKVHEMITTTLTFIDGDVLIGFSTFANRDVVTPSRWRKA